jgi:hypothetical protein
VGKAVERNRFADDRRIAVIPEVPDFVAQHHDALGARTIVLGREVAAESRRCSEKAEQAGGDRRAVETLRLCAAVGERQAAAGKGGHGRQRGVLVADVAKVQPRHARPRDTGPLIRRIHYNDPAGVRIRERLQQHPVHDTENGGIQADAERKAEDGG